jgi:hypothetical protein
MNEWTKNLLHLRKNMSVQVSIDNTDDGREFVRLEFEGGGYISLELDENGVGIEAFDAEGDVIGVDGISYDKFAPKEVCDED